MSEAYQDAANAVKNADAIVITTGAGMGVDSGLPDFRGDKGFWNAYPLYERLGINFVTAANPANFEGDPAFGWGFYGHRTNLYRETVPHEGYHIIMNWINELGLKWFAVTSNVDGQFQKAGYNGDSVLEVHGSIHHLQCTSPCNHSIWDNDETFDIDFETMRSRQVPACRVCGKPSRPNILMFGDYAWIADRTARQEDRFQGFLGRLHGKHIVVIEMGAGTHVPTIRYMSERLGTSMGAKVIRINPREPQIKGRDNISICAGALEALEAIDSLI